MVTLILKVQQLRKIKILVDDEDFEKLKNLSVTLCGQSMGVVSTTINGKTTSLGRLLLNYDGPLEVDHKDHNKFNFQKSNLRLATRSQQMANSKPQLNRKYKGVSFRPDNVKYPYRAVIKVKGKAKSLDYWETEELAAKAYDKAAKKYFGEFARLNFPEELSIQ